MKETPDFCVSDQQHSHTLGGQHNKEIIKSMHTMFGGYGKTAKFPFPTMDYRPW